MKAYWDTSAALWFYGQGRAAEIAGVTRPHTLAEMFSALSGNGVDIVQKNGRPRRVKFSPALAAAVVEKVRPQLEFQELTAEEVSQALASAQSKAVQGGRVHDYLHAVAAEKAGADELWTLDQTDFAGLGKAKLKNPAI